VFLANEFPEIAAIVEQAKLDTEPNQQQDDGVSILTNEQEILRDDCSDQANKVMREYMKDITQCLEFIGFVKPMNKVYSLSQDLHHMPLMLALVSLNALNYI